MEKFFAIRSRNGQLAAVLHEAGETPSGDSSSNPKKLVILAHGYTGTKCESLRLFVQTARALADAGINALRFDFWGSGDSEGRFDEASPNTEIADLHDVIAWARKRKFSEIGVLGLSLGGAVSICTSAENPHVKTLVTWSALPKFAGWFGGERGEAAKRNAPLLGGRKMITDHPSVDVPEAYVSLRIPKLQIQGDRDNKGFMEKFKEYFAKAPAPKKHIVVPGADHVFTTWPERRKVIGLTVRWFQKHL